ncbi:MAG: aminodeoxychorismate synthase component I [Dongiaceae bacterium]
MTQSRVTETQSRTPLVDETDWRAPETLVAALPTAPGTVFLDSAMSHPELGRWSYLAFDPFGHFMVRDGQAIWNGELLAEAPIEALRLQLRRYAVAREPEMPSYLPGATGAFSYEAGALFERLPPPRATGPAAPEIELWFHDAALVFDRAEQRLFIVSTGWPETERVKQANRREARATWLRDWLRNAGDAAPHPHVRLPRDAWRSNLGRRGYEKAVSRTRAYILAGDVFQANIAQRFSTMLPVGWDAIGLYDQLRIANPATFGAFVAGADQTLLSMSPERFLRLRDGQVETRPIKGTRGRSTDQAEDRRLADELIASAKDRAENVMIVDLLRNDLSRVSKPGTVNVPMLCGLESYAAVHHLVSVVTSQLHDGADALDLLAACFPGGSVTGAPKIRAMEIIHELEPDRRGVYCGSIAHLGFDGSLESNIAIRTLVCAGREASFHAGGGITLLSDPAAEYEETLIKAERVFAAFEAG